jgi:peptide/nickel transport system ATP-binding protein
MIRFNSGKKVYNIAKTPTEVMETIRGSKISMVFQEPMTSLNPVFRVGDQIDEVVKLHNPEMTKEQVKELSLTMIDTVGIANNRGVYRMYPHELSGGMRQRIMIAMALACSPRLIIADEPTTALDVTIQAQILDLLRNLKDRINSSIMLITHDLGVIAEMADHVVVMYAGRIVEKGTAEEVFHNPLHPYTVGLMASKPVMNKEVQRLYSIPGSVPNPINMPDYCYFRDRCDKRIPVCDGVYPPEIYVTETHMVTCYRHLQK